MVDGVVRAGLGAHAAVDALLLVDIGLLVLEGNGALGADLAAGVREATLAGVAHLIDVVFAGVAGELDDVDQRRLVVGLGNRGVDDAVGHALRLVDALQRQAHGKEDALRDDGALEEDGLAVGRDLAGDDLVGQALEVSLGVLPLLVGDAGDAREDLSANLGKVGIDTTHSARHKDPSPLLVAIFLPGGAHPQKRPHLTSMAKVFLPGLCTDNGNYVYGWKSSHP